MAFPLLLIDLGRRLLFNRWTLLAMVALAAYGTGYFKGSASVKARQAAQGVQEATETAVVQEKLEVAHDKRVRKILSNPVTDVECSRLLSTWPDQTSVTR